MTCPVSRPPAVVGIYIWAIWIENSVVLIIRCPVSKHRELTCKTQNAHISQAQANRYAHLFLQNLYRLLLCENRHLKNSDMCVMQLLAETDHFKIFTVINPIKQIICSSWNSFLCKICKFTNFRKISRILPDLIFYEFMILSFILKFLFCLLENLLVD